MNEAKITRKQFFIIMGILLASLLIIVLILRGAKNTTAPLVSDITFCDQNSSDLCIVTFGTTGPDRMVINFQLPREDYPEFRVKGSNRGISYDYSCYVADAVPTSVYCTGPRTPLGEYIDLEVYTVKEDLLLAREKVFVSALIVWTSAGTPEIPSINDTPAVTSETGTPDTTPLPGTAYPNTLQATVTSLPGTAYPNP